MPSRRISLYIYLAYFTVCFENIFPDVFLCFFTLFFHSLFISHLPPSLNSIAYRRVIRVYQYEVDDDLSGRSSPFFPPLIGLLPLTPHTFWVFLLLMHLSLIPTVKALCVCSIPFTNIHCDVRLFLR